MKPLSRARAAAARPLFAVCVTASIWGQSAMAATDAKAPFKADTARGQQLVTQVCGACHTADGTRGAAANPILQGQHPEYLVKQLREFKTGKRKNAVMQGMAATLSDDDMQHVAAFYASKTAKPGFAKNKATVELGERIYRGGIASQKIPACAGCHSPTGAGIPAQYPRMAGQHADYTELQLTGFRNGTRANSAQMTAIAAKLGEREAKAVADYIAGLR
jgi:cytochrome c553